MNRLSLFIREKYKTTFWGYYFITPFKLCYDFIVYRLIPPKAFIRFKYYKAFGAYLNLEEPQTFNEKIQWLKVFYNKSDFHRQCVDKLDVKGLIKELIGPDYVVPLVFSTENPSDIKESNMPDYPVIIKANHNSGGYYIVKDKESVDWKKVRRLCRKWLKENYYYIGKEQQYRNIRPQIFVEKLLIDDVGNIPFDYKVHCVNGKPRMIQIDLNRGTSDHCRSWYNTDWKREPYKWSSIYPNGQLTDPCIVEIPKPQKLSEMLKLSESLAEKFPYVRIDWYIINEKIYFGEYTFHHDGGFRPILPNKYDFQLGQELKLPKINNL